MNTYKQQALSDVLNLIAQYLLEPYSSAGQLNTAVKSGRYNGKLYLHTEGKDPKVIATFRIEPDEGKVFYTEGSTWVVWYNDIMSRWYRENTDFLDSEVSQIMRQP